MQPVISLLALKRLLLRRIRDHEAERTRLMALDTDSAEWDWDITPRLIEHRAGAIAALRAILESIWS